MMLEAKAEFWIDRAVSECGLPPRGVESLREGLELFLAEYVRAGTATPHGLATTSHFIAESLKARFRIEDWLVRHPHLLERPVEKPVFILGLPRAGTTTLINMLAHDPQRRFYYSWEALAEVPPAHRDHMHDDPRIAAKVAEINAALDAGLLDHRQHVELGHQPAEEALLLGQDFKSYLWLSRAVMPRYFEWFLFEADMDAAYGYHKRALQVMQSEAPGKWTLKFPSHALAIDSILRVYPDARIIVSHRDPVKSVGSSADAENFFVSTGNANVDRKLIGQHNLTLLSTAMRRVMAAERAAPAGQFYGYQFRRFMADPIAEVRRIYAFLGDDLPEAVVEKMRGELADIDSIRKEHGSHIYSLDDYGLSASVISEAFADYIDHYAIDMETR